MATLCLLLFAVQISSLCVPARAAEEAQTTQPGVLVVFVFDKSCKVACTKVRPFLKELQTEYAGKAEFVELDVSKDCIKESEKTAKSLHVGNFLQDTEEWYPAVGVFSARRKLVKQILGAKSKDSYKLAIDKAIAAQ